MNDIEHTIYAADISLGAALEGDCGPIARAIHAVFGGTYAITLDDDGSPRHAAVLIDGELYDGTGKTTVADLCITFAHHEHPTDESPEDSPNIRLTDTLDGFRHDRELTVDIETRLQ